MQRNAYMKVLGIAALCLCAGCGYHVGRVEPSIRNVETLRGLIGATQKIRVGAFTGSKSWRQHAVCRSGEQIKLSAADTFEDYLAEAMTQELRSADLYSDSAPISLVAHVKNVNFETDVAVRSFVSTMKGGRWNFMAAFEGTGGKPFEITEAFEFRTHLRDGWTDEDTCKAVAAAFRPAVQSLLGKVYQTPEFKALLGIVPPKIAAAPTEQEKREEEHQKRMEKLLGDEE